MSGQWQRLPNDPLEELTQRLGEVKRRLSELEAPTGTQVFEALQKVQQLIADIGIYVDAYLATGFTTGSMNATGSVNVGGSLDVAGSITGDVGVASVGVFNNDLAAISGTRRTQWIHQSGAMGYASSSITKKTNLTPFPVDADAFMSVAPYLFQYKALIDIRDNPENPNHDPDLEVPFEPGFIAEELDAAGLGMFVFREADGTPAGINYDMFAAVGFSVIARNHEERLRAIEGD